MKYITSIKNQHIIQWFGYPETLQDEGKIGVGMKPTNLHYCNNKVNLLGLQCLIIKYDLPFEGSSLCNTPPKGSKRIKLNVSKFGSIFFLT